MIVRRRRNPFRSITFVSALLVALAWAGGSGWWVSRSWPWDIALAKVEQARSEARCNTRWADPSFRSRCRELVAVMARADRAHLYFNDAMVVFGPSFLLIGMALWLRGRSDPPRRHPHHRRASAA